MCATSMDPDPKPCVHTRWTRKGGPKTTLFGPYWAGLFAPSQKWVFLRGLSPGHTPPQPSPGPPLPCSHTTCLQSTLGYVFIPLSSLPLPLEHSNGPQQCPNHAQIMPKYMVLVLQGAVCRWSDPWSAPSLAVPWTPLPCSHSSYLQIGRASCRERV